VMVLIKRVLAGVLIVMSALALIGNLGGDTEQQRAQNRADWPRMIGASVVAVGLAAVLLWSAHRTAAARKRVEAIAGYVRVHPHVKVSELASYLGLTGADAESELHALVHRKVVDLVYYPSAGEYISRDEAKAVAGRVVDRCESCGAHSPRLVALGEMPRCSFCGQSLVRAGA